MPVPGPRTQQRPDPGYRNPENREPDLFNHWLRPDPVFWPGRSPGMMVVTLRGCVLGAGQIRRLWRQSVNKIAAQGDFSWTEDANDVTGAGPVDITRALRYMTRSIYAWGGADHTRFDNLHTTVYKRNMYKTVTVNKGQNRNRPTVRNRMTSFGARVPTLNQQVVAAQRQSVGGASQA